MAQPNFLLFISDQQRADHLGCYGSEVARTPAIDALAAAGWTADRFYTATPICMPNRASLMTPFSSARLSTKTRATISRTEKPRSVAR